MQHVLEKSFEDLNDPDCVYNLNHFKCFFFCEFPFSTCRPTFHKKEKIRKTKNYPHDSGGLNGVYGFKRFTWFKRLLFGNAFDPPPWPCHFSTDFIDSTGRVDSKKKSHDLIDLMVEIFGIFQLSRSMIEKYLNHSSMLTICISHLPDFSNLSKLADGKHRPRVVA